METGNARTVLRTIAMRPFPAVPQPDRRALRGRTLETHPGARHEVAAMSERPASAGQGAGILASPDASPVAESVPSAEAGSVDR